MNQTEKFPTQDNNETKPFRGTEYWKNQIAAIEIPFFNDVVTENRPPNKDSGYTLVEQDIPLPDGSVVDIYHSDIDNNMTIHRVFLHIKN